MEQLVFKGVQGFLHLLDVGTQYGYSHSAGLVKNVSIVPVTDSKVYVLSLNQNILTKLILNVKF